MCETNLCLMFTSEPPYALVSNAMEKQNNQTLCLCKKKAAIFRGLRGISFVIMDKMKEMDGVFVFILATTALLTE